MGLVEIPTNRPRTAVRPGHILDTATKVAYFSDNLLRAVSALEIPPLNPITFDKDFASSYLSLAAAISPSISANSPRLWVATAHARSHSSVLSGGAIFVAISMALTAQARAFDTRVGRDTGA